jgi:uncharacterized damage-inducible protein DinB
MANTSQAAGTATDTAMPSAKEQFLAVYDKEHATTMRVLRAFPTEHLELRPHAKCNTARQLGWTFVLERFLGMMVFNDTFPEAATGETPPPPDSWDEMLATLEKAHADFGQLIRATPDAELLKEVRFFTAPHTMGKIRRIDWIWFLLHDEIHHRGQFSIYLRMADGKVPSIYGPTADEPWM